jgi:hypothetical protein
MFARCIILDWLYSGLQLFSKYLLLSKGAFNVFLLFLPLPTLPPLCLTSALCRAVRLPYLTPVLPMTSILFSWKGLMGHGIAQIAAHAGFQVLAIEATDAALNIGITR